jgi:hypothetical protein
MEEADAASAETLFNQKSLSLCDTKASLPCMLIGKHLDILAPL